LGRLRPHHARRDEDRLLLRHAGQDLGARPDGNEWEAFVVLKDNLPEQAGAPACCGGPAPKEVDACCVKDADAKAAGTSGCGCSTATA
jgi:hypothetical protein